MPEIDLELGDFTTYGQYLVLDITGGTIHQGAGQGVVVSLGNEVSNYDAGGVIQVGETLLFRDGTQIKLSSGEGGKDLVFVSMADVLAIVVPPATTPETTPG